MLAHGADQRQGRNYRPDIDGLRAVAVLSITLFHFDFRRVAGGFVGVDVFFVISGYLIGGMVLRQYRADNFQLGEFYERRLRRIVPALAVALLGTTLAATLVLLPVPLEQYAATLMAATLSVSNVYFWLNTDYFAPAAASQPLLHTWSLGVEEQFYIIFPLLLWLLHRFKLPSDGALAALALSSFALSVAITQSNPLFNFYSLPTRAWQLLLGALVASTAERWRWSDSAREVAAIAGLGMIAGSILTMLPTTPFPGLTAVPATLGTALIIAAGTKAPTLVGRALSLKPVVFFGLISYSLYLWHWPVVVMIREYMPEAWLRMPERFAGLALAVFLGWLSWAFVERPFRSTKVSGKRIFLFSGSSAVVLVGIAAIILVGQGLPQRYSPDVQRVAAYLDPSKSEDRSDCIIGLYGRLEDFDERRCLRAAKDRPNVLLIGDSHANHLRGGLEHRLVGANVLQASAAGCRTLIMPGSSQTETCARFRRFLFERLARDPPAKTIVLSNFWSEDGLPALAKTLDWLRARGFTVVLAGPIPRYESPLPQVVALALVRNDHGIIARNRIPGIAQLDRQFASVAERHGARYWSLYAALCPKGRCTAISEAIPVQFDSAHLSGVGSRLVVQEFPSDLMAEGVPLGATSADQMPDDSRK